MGERKRLAIFGKVRRQKGLPDHDNGGMVKNMAGSLLTHLIRIQGM